MRPDIRRLEHGGFYSLHLRGLSDSKILTQPEHRIVITVSQWSRISATKHFWGDADLFKFEPFQNYTFPSEVPDTII